MVWKKLVSSLVYGFINNFGCLKTNFEILLIIWWLWSVFCNILCAFSVGVAEGEEYIYVLSWYSPSPFITLVYLQ